MREGPIFVSSRIRSLPFLALAALVGCGGDSPGAPAPRIEALPIDMPTPAPSPSATPAPAPTPAPSPTPLVDGYPFYMPMTGLRAPATTLFVRCDASRAAGREVYEGRDGASLYGRAEGGFEFVYEALDGAGQPCVYPFAPWQPQVVGSLQGTQYILRSSVPGRRVTFRTSDPWATINLRLFQVGAQRVHFEMRDIELDFPGAVQPMGALHLEVVDTAKPGLFTAVVRRAKLYGGKNAIFAPSGETMLYVEDSEIAGNVGTNNDQEHATYINGTLVSHFRNSSWRGQLAWENIASGHQLKDKAYLRIYENVTVSNAATRAAPSAMPMIDASAFGFTWSDGLRLQRVRPAQEPRESLVDLRTEIVYGPAGHYPWNLLANADWRMPADPLTVLDRVYLSVFRNTTVESFRTEPYVFALRPQGTRFTPTGGIEGNETTTRGQQRMVSLAFNTTGTFQRAYSPEGWTYADPRLPVGAEWVTDRDAFIRHALGLIGR